MKKIFYLSLLLLNFTGFSQNPISLTLGKSNYRFSDNTLSFNLKDISFATNLSDKKNYSDKYLLTVYNPTSKLNDNYTLVSNKYYLSNYRSFPNYNFNGMKKDSFNPSGVSNFGSAVGIGFLNLLFEKF